MDLSKYQEAFNKMSYDEISASKVNSKENIKIRDENNLIF